MCLFLKFSNLSFKVFKSSRSSKLANRIRKWLLNAKQIGGIVIVEIIRLNNLN